MLKDVEIWIENANLATMAGGTGPLAGSRQGDIGRVEDGVVAVGDGRILAIGPRRELQAALSEEPGQRLDAGGRLVLPGFVDAHTHPIWAGSRAAEFEQRIAGASYVEIMEAGGGIASTVRATREAGDEVLLADLLARLDRLMAEGVTTVEAKTGYGLSTAEELRHLRILARAEKRHPVHIVPTFLGAHAVPPEYRGRQSDYVELVIEEMLPAVAEAWPGVFCDVFCDEGAFTLAETRRILERARNLGMPLKVHSDEFVNLGCTAMAAEFGARSADHLVAAGSQDIQAMADAGSIAVLLPGTTFGLGSSHYAPAREMVARGLPVALGTDLNPGTCPSESMPLMLAIAARYLRLTPAEGLVAATRNAAESCGRGERAGRLAPGWPADLILIDSGDYRDLAYRFGSRQIDGVMIDGRWTIAPGAAG